MGLGYSDLHVYFYSKKDQAYGSGYTVTPTQKTFEGCSDFQVITHAISFTKPDDGLNYNVLLYDGYDNKTEGNYVFGYYYPRNPNEVIKQVDVYYSVLAPNVPLVISFVTKGDQNYNCVPQDLKDAGWDRAYKITEYNSFKSLSKIILDGEYNKLSRKRKIKFTIGKEKVDIFADKQELGNDKSYRFIFTPKGNLSVLGSNYMFAINFNSNEPICPDDPDPEVPRDCKRLQVYKKCTQTNKNSQEKCRENLDILAFRKSLKYDTKHPNKIDEYFLRSFTGELYDGIIVYFEKKKARRPKQYCGLHEYNNNKVLLLEFIESSKPKKHLKRKDSEGYCWVEDSIKYTSDTELSTCLGEIQQGLDQNAVTVIIDEKRQYNGLEGFESGGTNKVCKKYTYKFNKANNPIIVFARSTISITAKGLKDVKAKHVEVYYLNAGGKEDTQPFLIVFDEKGDGKEKKNNKPYHFTNSEKFEEWKPFEFKNGEENLKDEKLIEKLELKIKQIETNGGCIPNLTLLRWYAHEILIGKEPDPPTKEEEVTPQKPKPFDPPPKEETLPIWLIVGCVAAGVVLIVTLVVVYGIYWYNTTIKLLT
ncbi:conserved hypothetical protein [Theileria orientalis strain Shintoku]|uniref:Uncharacterized protein n=1 Tax=Theileria orientalis strain Shintoku TaxID=869250 RepID=J4CDL7_THEOR|nr:conserved hypothetical protein [Theileria orientalis strain Shintoku]BAM41362.1 conserved hypothetical protein [Theileria orientalis strain Shintoku]|eukprot:XP_009691663.1 conserved hypothetical protein [Theileria orientalis strain Shintoku]